MGGASRHQHIPVPASDKRPSLVSLQDESFRVSSSRVPSVIETAQRNDTLSDLAIPEVEDLKEKFLRENKAAEQKREIELLREGATLLRNDSKAHLTEPKKRFIESVSFLHKEGFLDSIMKVAWPVTGIAIAASIIATSQNPISIPLGLVAGTIGGFFTGALTTIGLAYGILGFHLLRAGPGYQAFRNPTEKKFLATFTSLKKEADKICAGQSFTPEQRNEIEKVLREKAAMELDAQANALEEKAALLPPHSIRRPRD